MRRCRNTAWSEWLSWLESPERVKSSANACIIRHRHFAVADTESPPMRESDVFIPPFAMVEICGRTHGSKLAMYGSGK